MADTIDRATIQSLFGSGSWKNSQTYSNPNNTYWVAAPVIIARLYTNASGLSSNSGSVTVYRWDASQGKFVQHSSGSTKGGFGASNNTWRFRHNCTESANASDTSGVHLWKFVVSTSGGGTKEFSLYAGHVGINNNANSDTYRSGGLIRGIKPDYWAKGGTYSSDEAFVSGEGPDAHRGTAIDHTNGYYCYAE